MGAFKRAGLLIVGAVLMGVVMATPRVTSAGLEEIKNEYNL